MTKSSRFFFIRMAVACLLINCAIDVQAMHRPEALHAIRQTISSNQKGYKNRRNIPIFTAPVAISFGKIVAAAASGVTGIFALKSAVDYQRAHIEERLATEEKKSATPDTPVKYNTDPNWFSTTKVPEGISIAVPVAAPQAEPEEKLRSCGLQMPEPELLGGKIIMPEPELKSCAVITPEPKLMGGKIVTPEPNLKPCVLNMPDMPKPAITVSPEVNKAALDVLMMAKELSPEQKKDLERIQGMTDKEIKEAKLSKTPYTHKDEFKTLKNGQGLQCKDGLFWKLDHFHHKNHWDVSDKNGNFVKEVSLFGRDLGGIKNNSNSTKKTQSTMSDRSTRVKENDKHNFVKGAIATALKLKGDDEEVTQKTVDHIDLSDADLEHAWDSLDIEMKAIEEKSEKIAALIAEQNAHITPEAKTEAYNTFVAALTAPENNDNVISEPEIDEWQERKDREDSDAYWGRYIRSHSSAITLDAGDFKFTDAEIDAADIAGQLDAIDFSQTDIERETAALWESVRYQGVSDEDRAAAWESFTTWALNDKDTGAE